MPVVLKLPGQIARRHLFDLPYDAPEFNTCSASAVSVGKGGVIESFVHPPRVASAYPPQKTTWAIPDLEARWRASLERAQEITESSTIVIGNEVFPISSIPPENLEVIKLLDEWFSEPDDLGEEAWKEYDRILAEGLRF